MHRDAAPALDPAGPFSKKEQRYANERAAAEADELPPGEI